MFKFLKDKLKSGVAKFSKKVDEQGEEEVIETPIEPSEEPKKEGFLSKVFKKKQKEEPVLDEQDALDEPDPEKVKAEVEKEEEQAIDKESKKEPKSALPEEPTLQEQEDLGEDAKQEEEIEKQPIPEPRQEVAISEVEAAPEEAKEEVVLEEEKEEKKQAVEEPLEPVPEEQKKKGFFAKIKERVVTKRISKEQFDELFFELEVALLENNVAMEVIDKLKDDLAKEIVDKPLPRKKIEAIILSALKESVERIITIDGRDLIKDIESKKPYVICFIGINGSGKTTSIAKVTRMLQDNGKSVVLAAADTFRAAAIDQLQIHADNLGVKMIKHDYGSDPAAVAFDAIGYAKGKDADVVLIDTAGRLHSNNNLIDEMKKIIRVANPDMKIFVGESITGNDCVEQAKKFDEAVGIDGIILSKADIDEKGGAALSIAYVTKRPILYMGTGQNYADLTAFDPKIMLESLGLTS